MGEQVKQSEDLSPGQHSAAKRPCGGRPCGGHPWTFIWFGGALALGIYLTCQFAEIDRWMYTNNAQVIDYERYRENRRAASSLPSERIDPRARGDLRTARSAVLKENRTQPEE